MDKEKRDNLRRLHEAATKGEWKATLPRSGRWQISNGRVQVAAMWSTTSNPGKDVAEFIAAAHNALPALLDALEAAESEVERLKTWRIETKDKTDCWECDGTACTENGSDCATCAGTGLMTIYARDARMKREGAAELEGAKKEAAQARDGWVRTLDQRDEFHAHAAALRKAGRAVVDRWDSPTWADLPRTGVAITALRLAIAATPAASLSLVRAAECRRIAECIRVAGALNAAYHAAWIDGEADRIESEVG